MDGIDWNAFNDELTASDKKDLENLGSGESSFVEVPDGKYEVKLTRLELGMSKAGNPTAYINFQVLSGDEADNTIYYTMSVGGNKKAWKLSMFTNFVTKLKSGVPFTYDEFKTADGGFDGFKFEDSIEQAYEAITKNGIEYAIEKTTNSAGYTKIEIIDVYDE